jgi:sugar phosphate isomerase/epimerase
VKIGPQSWRKKLGNILFYSHFIHDVYWRASQFLSSNKPNTELKDTKSRDDLILTSKILEELKKEVERRGAKLLVFLIPSKREIERLDNSVPYQIEIAELCRNLGVEHVNLAPAFEAAWYRTYYREGMHWNSYGHRVAAEAIYDYLSSP